MHKIDFYNRICITKRLPVRKRLSKPLASVATFASRQGNYRFRLANVFASLFLPSRIFIIKQFFYKTNFMFNFKKLEFRAIYFFLPVFPNNRLYFRPRNTDSYIHPDTLLYQDFPVNQNNHRK